MDSNDEKKWLLKMAADNKIAFDKLFNQYWDEVYQYVIKVIGDHDDTSDILQATFLALWEQRQKLVQIDSVRAYIFSIARFQAFNHIRRSKYQLSLKESILFYFNEAAVSPEDLYISAEMEGLIFKEIDSLPPKMKEIFVLSRQSGFSYKEISIKLNISENTVKKQISNSLRYLRLKLDDKHFYCMVLVIWFR